MTDEQALELFAECSKNLVTIGSALIVTAYVAFAQFSHQSGELSVLQSRAFFRYVLTPRFSGIGFLLLLLACGLSGDKAPWQMVCVSLFIFFVAAGLHGTVLVKLYLWSKDPSSKVSPTLSGDGVRARYVRQLLIQDRSTPSDVKLGYVLEHFEKLKSEDQTPSPRDKEYAVWLFKVVIRRSYKRYIRAAELSPEGPFTEMARGCVERNLQHAKAMFSMSQEHAVLWYDSEFSKSLVIRTRHRPRAQLYGIWPMREFWLSFLRVPVPIGHRPDWLQLKIIDALLAEASNDFYFNDGGFLVEDASFVNGHVMMEILKVVFMGDFESSVPTLVAALKPENKTAFALFVRLRLRDYLNGLRSNSDLAYLRKYDDFSRFYFPDTSLNHLRRLLQLDRDIVNQDVRRFIDFIFQTLGESAIVCVDGNEDIEARYRERRLAAELFCLPITSQSRVRENLQKMKDSLERFAEEAKSLGKQREHAGAIEALKFLKEHWDYLEDRERQRGS
jgi:hypothetical protein